MQKCAVLKIKIAKHFLVLVSQKEENLVTFTVIDSMDKAKMRLSKEQKTWNIKKCFIHLSGRYLYLVWIYFSYILFKGLEVGVFSFIGVHVSQFSVEQPLTLLSTKNKQWKYIDVFYTCD